MPVIADLASLEPVTEAQDKQEFNTQIAIIGGGSAGACCALALRQQGFNRVTLIESSAYDQFRIGESIPPESKHILSQLGIWNEFLAQQHQPCYGSCSWWGDERRGYNDSLLNPHGHGWHLNRVKFNQFLADQARNKQVELLTDCQFLTALPSNRKSQRLELKLRGQLHYLNADFVVDASGAKGLFAKSQGSQKIFSTPLICSSRRYQIIDKNHPLTGLTYLEAVDSGWWYAARLPEQQLLISHTTDNETFRQRGLKNEPNWTQELLRSPNTCQLLKGSQAVDPKPVIYSAPSFVLDKMTGENWLAIGDAASSFDPVTSQGIIKSMSDGVLAASCVADYLGKGVDAALGAYQAIVGQRHQQYRQLRQYYYRLETRFADSLFWQKIQSQM